MSLVITQKDWLKIVENLPDPSTYSGHQLRVPIRYNKTFDEQMQPVPVVSLSVASPLLMFQRNYRQSGHCWDCVTPFTIVDITKLKQS